MTNIAKTINNYIKSNISGLTFYNDLFPDSLTEGVITIHDPSSRKIAEYVDGTAEFELKISFTARFKKAQTARSKLDAILTLLDRKKITDNTDNLDLSINTVANVQFVGTDDKNFNIYTCSIAVSYTNSNFI